MPTLYGLAPTEYKVSWLPISVSKRLIADWTGLTTFLLFADCGIAFRLREALAESAVLVVHGEGQGSWAVPHLCPNSRIPCWGIYSFLQNDGVYL